MSESLAQAIGLAYSMPIAVQFLRPGATLPERAHETDACYDIRACWGEEFSILDHFYIPSGGRVLVPTGIAFGLPPGWEAQVRPRSGLATKAGVTVLNAPGTIDAGYRGEVMVNLYNTTRNSYPVRKGDRIAQVKFDRVPAVQLVQVESLDSTDRGDGGHGSTGR